MTSCDLVAERRTLAFTTLQERLKIFCDSFLDTVNINVALILVHGESHETSVPSLAFTDF